MYLSKLELDPTHPLARRDLANAYEMHRTLSRVFVMSPDAPPARFLWRQEHHRGDALGDTAIVLVQAATPGNWRALDELAGYTRKRHPDKDVDLTHLLRPNRTLAFRLACNPTVTRAGKRYGLMHDPEQQAWLQRQGQRHGFEVVRAEISRSEQTTFRQGRGGHHITVQVVQFDGLLRVTEPDRLATALSSGIGHAKALGLGMISLAPVTR